jgi:K+-transporting ATPase ATPase A chain
MVSALALGAVTVMLTFVMLRLQDRLPLNPQSMAALKPDLAANTAISFTSNTGWEIYVGEQTLSYLSQMVAVMANMFLSMAVGLAVAVALIRGFARREAATVGNFWVGATRAILYVELPLAMVLAVFLASQGVIQKLEPYTVVHTVQGGVQLLAQGPVASMEPIQDMSGAGGGFFNASSAHPFEDPNGLTHQLELDLQLVIPFAVTITFGRMVGRVWRGRSPASGW